MRMPITSLNMFKEIYVKPELLMTHSCIYTMLIPHALVIAW